MGGRLFRPGDPADLARVIRRTLEDADLLATLRANLPRVETIAEHGERVEALYAELLEGRRARPRA